MGYKRTQAELEKLYARTVECKRRQGELKTEFDAIKAEWKEEAETHGLVGGVGSITAMEIDGEAYGVMWSRSKGSPSATKLKEHGVALDIVEACRGESLDFKVGQIKAKK